MTRIHSESMLEPPPVTGGGLALTASFLERLMLQAPPNLMPAGGIPSAGRQVGGGPVWRDFRFRPGNTVLNLGGAATGVPMFIARRYGIHVVVIEANGEVLAEAARLAEAKGLAGSITFLKGSVGDYDLPEQGFDEIVCQDSAGFRLNPREYFKGMRRLLRPGGAWRSADWYGIRPSPAGADPEDGGHPYWRGTLRHLVRAGFVRPLCMDLTPVGLRGLGYGEGAPGESDLAAALERSGLRFFLIGGMNPV